MNASYRHWFAATALAGLIALPAAAQDAATTEPLQNRDRQMLQDPTQDQTRQRLQTQDRVDQALPDQAADPAQTRSKQQQGVMKQQQQQQKQQEKREQQQLKQQQRTHSEKRYEERRELRQNMGVERGTRPMRGKP